jgi:hypothetical protein
MAYPVKKKNYFPSDVHIFNMNQIHGNNDRSWQTQAYGFH